MTDRASDLVAFARDDLTVARRSLEEGFPRHAVSRAYYAAFHAASAVLDRAGHRPKTHAGTRALFAEAFIRDGPFTTAHGRTLSHLERLRTDADYHTGKVIGMETAQTALDESEAFVSDLAAWIDGGGR